MDRNRAFVPLFSMHARKNLPPLTVSLLALPETTPTILYSLYEVFLSVGVTWSELTGERSDVRRMAPRIVAATKNPFISAIGLPVTPQATLDEVDVSDLVVVTDLVIPPGQSPRGRWSLETAWVRDQFTNGAMVTSVCTGSLFLAEAGLLDGQAATTHWSAAETFRASYPEVELAAERTLCPAGTEHRLVTSGGAAAWEDLALYLIARFCGEAEALHIAKIFVLGDRSEGQLAHAAMTRPRKHSDAVIADCQTWIAQNYAESHPVSHMIERSGLAQRTFKRRFQAATGYTPVDYVQALRIEEAKQLLETGDLSTEEVAHAIGYEDPVYFRRLFKRRTCTTPARYRKRFQRLVRGDSPN
ncbi:MAG: GlxA family transcriptional regulator [Pseudomonadota bacterium]